MKTDTDNGEVIPECQPVSAGGTKSNHSTLQHQVTNETRPDVSDNLSRKPSNLFSKTEICNI